MQHFWWISFYFLKRNSFYVWSFKLFVLHSYYAQKHMGTIIIYCFNNLQHKKGMLAGSSFCTPPKNQWNHFQPLKRTVGNHLSLTIIMIIILLSIADGLCANFLSSYHILTSSVIYYRPDAQEHRIYLVFKYNDWCACIQ